MNVKRITLALVMLALVVIAGIVGHNVNGYTGADGQAGMTWGTAGGCEVSYSAAACWAGDRN